MSDFIESRKSTWPKLTSSIYHGCLLAGKKRHLNHFGGADVAILFFVHQCKRSISRSQIFYSSSTDVFLLKLWPFSQVSMHMRALAKSAEKTGSNNVRSPFYDHCFTFDEGVDAMVLLDLKRQVSQKHNCQCRFIQPLFVAIQVCASFRHHSRLRCRSPRELRHGIQKGDQKEPGFRNRCMVPDEYSFLWANSQQFSNWNG